MEVIFGNKIKDLQDYVKQNNNPQYCVLLENDDGRFLGSWSPDGYSGGQIHTRRSVLTSLPPRHDYCGSMDAYRALKRDVCKKRLTLKQKIDSLNISETLKKKESSVIKILAAYSDMHDDLVKTQRSLDFFCKEPFTVEEVIEIMEKIVGNYNIFSAGKTTKKITDLFSDNTEFFVAREGSVCLYVKPKRLWLDRGVDLLSSGADEVSFEIDRGFRFWFD